MIIVRLKGGLGNQMFQYALGRVLSIKNKVPLGFDTHFLLDRSPRSNFTFRNYNLDIFNIDANLMPLEKVPIIYKFKTKNKLINFVLNKFIIKKGKEKNFKFDPSILLLGPSSFLDGYWQSPKYFEGYEDIIRKDFTYKNEFKDNIKELSKDIQNKNSLCVHIRRGDYVGNKFHEVVGMKYYNDAVDILRKNNVIENIYVFSDDIEWCKKNLSFNFNTVFVGSDYAGEKDEGHMFLMSCCKYFIIPNSSFSWWGAWLSVRREKVVICPKQWFGDTSIDTSDLIPKEWIRI